MRPLERDEIENLQLEATGKVPLFPFQRNDILVKLNRIENMSKLKKSHEAISRLLDQMENNIKTYSPPKNPRESLLQAHSKRSLDVFKRQKAHMEEKMSILEKEIQKDINDSKVE